jgi:hypothetical protein
MRAIAIFSAVAWIFSAFGGAADAPALPIDQALQLAQDHLKSRGLAGQHYISSLTLEKGLLVKGASVWYARWTPVIRDGDRQESGVYIRMDGTVTRVVAEPPRERRIEGVGARTAR